MSDKHIGITMLIVLIIIYLCALIITKSADLLFMGCAFGGLVYLIAMIHFLTSKK